MSSYDITFCVNKYCKNYDCKRHISKTYGYPYPVSMGKFIECENWINKSETNSSTKK